MNASEPLISKELLSEVLGYQVTKISLLNTRTNSINITGDTEKYTPRTTSISIYELQHLCKEWAYIRYSISSWKQHFGYGASLTDLLGNSPKNLVITEATEPEAVFKACEFILRKIKGN